MNLPATGIRPGEKLHEEMITASDSHNTIDIGPYFAILPADNKEKFKEFYNDARDVAKGFSYNSGQNDQWVSVDEMRKLIKENIDPNFKPL